MKKVLSITITVIASMMLVAGSALAWSVDFTDFYYQAADGFATFYSDQDDLTLFAAPSPGVLSWNGSDGIGIKNTGYEDDEVEWEEMLTISFDNSVLLSEIFLTDFFYEDVNGQWYEEMGYVQFLDAGGTMLGGSTFTQTDHSITMASSNGEFVIDVASMLGGTFELVKDVVLYGMGNSTLNVGHHEFSVAGLNIVPEPGTMLLLGSGLLGVFVLVRRRRRK